MKSLIFGVIILMILASTQIKADEIVAEQLIRSSSSWNGDTLPTYPKGQPEVSILKFTIPAGAALPNHTHSAINAGILLSGTLTVVSEDGDELHMTAGDTLIELVGKVHHGQNDGDEPAVIVVFYAGIKGQEFTHLENADSH